MTEVVDLHECNITHVFLPTLNHIETPGAYATFSLQPCMQFSPHIKRCVC